MLNSAHRTNIVLDENVVQEALKLSNLKTRRALIDAALKEFVAKRKPKNKPDIHELFGVGGLYEGYDYKALRKNRLTDQE